MLARPHAYWGWMSVQPEDSRGLMEKLLRCRDAAVAADPSHSGQPETFQQWCQKQWLPKAVKRPFYRNQVEARLKELDPKIDRLADEAERLAASITAERLRLMAERNLLRSVIEVETNVDS